MALVAAMFVTGTAGAHGIGSSELRLRVAGPHVEGEWVLHLRDARWAVDLHPEVAGDPGWQDLREHEPALRAYLASRLHLGTDSLACPVVLTSRPMEWDPEERHVIFHLEGSCPGETKRLHIRCDVLFDRDSTHRAYYSVEDSRVTNIGVFRHKTREATVAIRQFHLLEAIGEFIAAGFREMTLRLESLLFVIALLLPIGLVHTRAGWSPRSLRDAFHALVPIVVGFALAYTLTLVLSFHELLMPPSNVVGAGVALGIFAAAWNNLRPFLAGRRWILAAAFGLAYGLAYSGALKNLSLPIHARGLALAAYNVGLDLGLVMVVVVLLPLFYVASRRGAYPRLIMGIASLGIAWVAAVWILERGFNVRLLTR